MKRDDILTYRMQCCTNCRIAGNNILEGGEVCIGSDEQIEYCIDSIEYSGWTPGPRVTGQTIGDDETCGKIL